MSEGNEVKGLTTLVQEAEQSVKDIKNPQMKLMAFGEVLKFLLEHETQPPTEGSRKKPRKTTSISRSRKSTKNEGAMKWLEELKEEKFFEKPKNSNEILKEFAERGHHLAHSDLTWPLQQCTKRKILRRKKMELAEGGKQVWHYSNW